MPRKKVPSESAGSSNTKEPQEEKEESPVPVTKPKKRRKNKVPPSSVSSSSYEYEEEEEDEYTSYSSEVKKKKRKAKKKKEKKKEKGKKKDKKKGKKKGKSKASSVGSKRKRDSDPKHDAKVQRVEKDFQKRSAEAMEAGARKIALHKKYFVVRLHGIDPLLLQDLPDGVNRDKDPYHVTDIAQESLRNPLHTTTCKAVPLEWRKYFFALCIF
jgi:type IV secretory pathway VirB10-like protein